MVQYLIRKKHLGRAGMKHKCKRMFSVDSQNFFIKNQIPLHIRDHLLRFDFQLKKPKNHWSLKRGFFLLKRTLSDEAKSFWRDRRMKEASDGDASQRRQELPRDYFTFWQHGFENEKKTFLLQKREKQLLCLLFVLFVSLPSDSNDLLSKCFNCRWDEVLPRKWKTKVVHLVQIFS